MQESVQQFTNAMNALIFAMWITSAVVVLLNWNVVIHQIKITRALSQGCTEMFPFIVMSGCVYGFGMVTQQSACFKPLLNMIMSINLNPYITCWLSVCLIAALCADGVSGMVMWLSIFGSQYGMGSALQVSGQVNPAAIHRIAVSAATTFDSLPHSPMGHSGSGADGVPTGSGDGGDGAGCPDPRRGGLYQRAV